MADAGRTTGARPATEPRSTTGGGGTTDPGSRGRLVVADRVVARIATRTAEGVDGVVPGKPGALAGLLGSGLPAVEVERGGRHVRLQVDVAIRWPFPAARLAAQVRDDVARRVAELTDLTVDGVSVTVRDVVRTTQRAEQGARVR